MLALVKAMGGVVRQPARLGSGALNRMLYQTIYHSMWWLYHFAFKLQRVELVCESPLIDLNTLGQVPRLYVVWHARGLAAVPLLDRAGELTMVSMPHKGWGNEGRLQSNLRRAFFANCHRMGFHFVELRKGESRDEVVGRVVERLQQGSSVMLTADSPKCGAFVAQVGSLLAASRSGVELVPMAFSSSRKIRINPFWDNFMVPVPFGTYHVLLGTPIKLPADLKPEALEQARVELASRLNDLTRQADDKAGIRQEYRLKRPDTALKQG